MIRRFELTGDLGIAPGRGRRPISSEIVDVTVAIGENAGRKVRSTVSLLYDLAGGSACRRGQHLLPANRIYSSKLKSH